jgi:DNA-directed RNA polymerase subunit N (RpoN/RPB10)
MSRFNVCPSCGNCIGKYYAFYLKAKEALIKEALESKAESKEYAAHKVDISDAELPAMETIFDAIGIKLRCCRMRIFGLNQMDKSFK